MLRTENFGFRLSLEEKSILLSLAEQEERDPSDLLRFLIRHAAKEHGWGIRGTAQGIRQVEGTLEQSGR